MFKHYKIIDFHCHIFPDNLAPKATQFLSDYYKVPLSLKGTLEDLQENAQLAGIDQMVVHSTATKATQVRSINNFISQICSENPNLIGFGSLHPDMEDITSEVQRIKKLGLHGIKLHPDFQGFKADSDRAFRLFDAIDSELPILIHAGDEDYDNSSPKRIAHVVDKFPNLTFIAAHLGGYRQWEEALEYLYQKDLYIDTSSSLWVLPTEKADFYIRAFSSMGKILFGTDYPMINHKDELERFFALHLSEKERGMILYDNAKQLLKL